MAGVLFHFIFVVFYDRAPEQPPAPAPGIEKNSIHKGLVAGSHYQRVVLARSVWIGFAPVHDERLRLEFLQPGAEVLRPMTTPSTLSLADVDQEHRKLGI